MATCPDGHESSTTDFCDVCGREIASSTSTPAPDPTGEPCPECGEPRSGRFCEGCSYDFVSGERSTSSPSSPAGRGTWTATVAADRAYYQAVRDEGGPDADQVPFPNFCPERVFPLSGKQFRIGRRSRSQGLTPEIDLTGPPQDPGVSHLHAILVAQPGDGWALVDPGSTNGTTLNEASDPIAVDTPVVLKDGDRIHIGAWTTITILAPQADSEQR
jgi:hypothetical protein